MDLNYLRKLIKIFDESSATDLTIEEEGIKLKIARNPKESKHRDSSQINMQPYVQSALQPQSVPAALNTQLPVPAASQATTESTKTEDTDSSLYKINSPIVGTFYRAPSPDSDPFVEVGAHVVPGQTLCIIEAMKLMNEIESDVAGTIVKILVQNTQPIEYNQTLFLIKQD